MKTKPELFFVQIPEPSEVRRNILESLKDILATMQRFEKFKDLRHRKLENLHKLRLLLRQANKMMADLKTKLPQTDLKAVVVKEQKPQLSPQKSQSSKQDSKQKQEPKPKKKELTELERLESELSAIEGKLKNL